MINLSSIRNSTQEALCAYLLANCGRAFLALCLIFSSWSTSTHAADSFFDIWYFGEGVATLAPGSDDPDSTTLVDGDSFVWNIAAQDGDFWEVETDGDFFPLMAFAVNPGGSRTGDFTLDLLNDGIVVHSFSDTGVLNKFVHLGTNSVSLSTGLIFDEMQLDYLLIEAIEDIDDAINPNDLQPIETTLNGLLPIFGAPEEAQSEIVYVVPEPATMTLGFLCGVELIASSRLRRMG